MSASGQMPRWQLNDKHGNSNRTETEEGGTTKRKRLVNDTQCSDLFIFNLGPIVLTAPVLPMCDTVLD